MDWICDESEGNHGKHNHTGISEEKDREEGQQRQWMNDINERTGLSQNEI